MKVLVIEDEVRLARAIKEGLEQETYAVDLATNGEEGYQIASQSNYDLIILDIMLPGLDGYRICQKLRSGKNKTPILMLTAKFQSTDIIRGLNDGADDYLGKPFSFSVLLARIQALLRRPPLTHNQVLRSGDLQLDLTKKEVRRSEQKINLSAKEYAVLEYLMRNKGQVISKDKIIDHVWDFESDILPNNVEAFISLLRSKIDAPFDGLKLIETVRGFGYKIRD